MTFRIPLARRRSGRVLVTLLLASSAVVASATASSAGPQSTSYAGVWSFPSVLGDGTTPNSVVGSVGADSGTTLTERASADYTDDVRAYKAGIDKLRVRDLDCANGNTGQTHMAFWGQRKDWWNAKETNGAAVATIRCYDAAAGLVYEYHWGHRENYCVKLNWPEGTGAARNTVTLTADNTCPTRLQVLTRGGKVLSSSWVNPGSVPFTATFTAPGAP